MDVYVVAIESDELLRATTDCVSCVGREGDSDCPDCNSVVTEGIRIQT